MHPWFEPRWSHVSPPRCKPAGYWHSKSCCSCCEADGSNLQTILWLSALVSSLSEGTRPPPNLLLLFLYKLVFTSLSLCVAEIVVIQFCRLPLRWSPPPPPQTASPIAGFSDGSSSPRGFANLWPGNTGFIYLLCSMLRIILDMPVERRKDSRKHTHPESRRCWAKVSNNRARKAKKVKLTWFSGAVSELGKDNGSLELRREMGTGLGKLAEAMRNIRIKYEVKEGTQIILPEGLRIWIRMWVFRDMGVMVRDHSPTP